MPTNRVPQSRAERLIAGGRLFLALASFGAIYLDPLEPSRSPTLTYGLLGSYAAYAVIIAGWTALSQSTPRPWVYTSHFIDLTFFGTINYLTFGPSSPFFIYFVFSIICAMLRFGRRGTLYTAAAALFVFVASGAGRLAAADFELNRFIIRATYLGVMASMLIYLAQYQERLNHDLQRIAQWPRSLRREPREILSTLTEEALSVFGARRVILAYAHLNAVYACVGRWVDGKFECTEEDDETASFLIGREGTYAATSPGSDAVVAGGDFSAIAARYQSDQVVATSFKGDFVRGCLVLLDGRLPLLEELNLARIAGGVIAGRLDHFHATQQLQRGAVAEERVRVARDLHDSVLQSLTGVALQLRTLPRLMSSDPAKARQRLGEVEQVLVSAQKELRWFIDELRPGGDRADDDGFAERLSSLAQRFHDHWGLEVANEIGPVIQLLPLSTRYEIFAIVNEAVANAAKHANARRVSVSVDTDDTSIAIDVADDGKGFPFHGRFGLKELMAARRGPVTLKERVGALGGSMIIDSSSAGSRLEIRLPLGRAT